MAIYFGRFSVLSRVNPSNHRTQSAVAKSAYQHAEKLRHFEASAAAAYIAGDLLETRGEGKVHNYANKKGVVYSEVVLPENAPANYGNREILWNAVEVAEKRKDAQLAREFVGALPRELGTAAQIDLVRDFVLKNFIANGMIADVAIHHPDYGENNPHVHIMLSMRKVTPDGFGKKERNWNQKSLLLSWREDWARVQNQHLERAGFDVKQIGVDHRSYKEQGSGLIGQYHEGKDATQLRRQGKMTEIAKLNEEIKQQNMTYLKEIEDAKKELTAEFDERIDSLYNELRADHKPKENDEKALDFFHQPVVLYQASSTMKPIERSLMPEPADEIGSSAESYVRGYQRYIDLSVERYKTEQEQEKVGEQNYRWESQIKNLQERAEQISRIEEAREESGLTAERKKLLDNKLVRARESLQRDWALSMPEIPGRIEEIRQNMNQSSRHQNNLEVAEDLRERQAALAEELRELAEKNPQYRELVAEPSISYSGKDDRYKSVMEQLTAKKAEEQLREALSLNNNEEREKRTKRDHLQSRDRGR